MAITNSASVAAGSADVTPAMTTFDLPFGFTATAGRILILFLAGDKSIGTDTTPTGYTDGPLQVNANVSLVTYYKISDGTETTATFLWTTNIRMAWGYVMEIDGVTLTGILSNSATSGNTNVLEQTTGTVTAPASESFSIAFFAVDSCTAYDTADIDGQPVWTDSFTRVAGQNDDEGTIPEGNVGFPGASVATRDVAASAGSISSTPSYSNFDQSSCAIILLPLLAVANTGYMTAMSRLWGP